MSDDYVHGYSERETQRLFDQASTLCELLHSGTYYPPGSKVLEAGCGVGAQTVLLAQKNPQARITSIDISPDSLASAKQLAGNHGIKNVEFRVADIFDPPFEDESFDHIFLCFVMEHLKEPQKALQSLKRVLRPGGSITAIEGDHGSAFFSPESTEASKAIECLVNLQRRSGGDAKVGRRLYPLLCGAGFEDVQVSPRMVYVDDSRPEWVEGFTKLTFTAMVEGVEREALDSGMMERAAWKKGIADLYRTAGHDGTFCYTFIKGVAKKPLHQ